MADVPPIPDDCTQLVRAARSGDRTAFGALYRDFARVVHGIALARCPAGELDDLVQDVFMTAFQQLPTLRDDAAFPAWLCAATRHAAVDRARRQKRAPASGELDDVAGRERSPAEQFAARDAAERVLACIRALPESYREPLVLRLVEGLTGPEIAARTGLTHGSVRVNLTRGMALLRPKLAEAGLP